MKSSVLDTILIVLFLALLSPSCETKEIPEEKTLETPTNVVVHKATETSLVFQWSLVAKATSYEWKLSQASTQVASGTVQNRNVSISDLEPGTEYGFTVRAVSQDTVSSWSAAVQASTVAVPEPPTPGPSSIEYAEFAIPEWEEDGIARAFPGAEGGGMYTTGGRGGRVIHVTNLNDSGAGSLRAALTASGPRTVVFDVAGVINLQSMIQIKHGDLTIAGQTAPGDGICIKNYSVNIDADNVIVRFLHFRLGDEGPNAGDSEDCIWSRYRKNIVIDHCSMSWSVDECASFYANENMTMQWCILTESMNNSAHSKGAHGYGGIWGGKNASFHHNLLANHHSRNPRPDHPEIYPKKSDGTFDLSRRGNVDFRNLVIYNWGDNSTYGGEGGHFNLVGCYYKPGPDSKNRYYFFDAYSIYSSSKTNYGYPALYMSGNVHTAHTDMTADNTVHGVYFHETGSYSKPSGYSFQTSQWPLTGPSNEPVYTSTQSAQDALESVLLYAGDSLHPDSVDKRATDGVRNNTGKIIDTPADVAGWPSYGATAEQLAATLDTDGDGIPDWFEEKAGLDKTAASDAALKSLDTKGRYSNLEMYLHYLVRDIMVPAVSGRGAEYMKIN